MFCKLPVYGEGLARVSMITVPDVPSVRAVAYQGTQMCNVSTTVLHHAVSLALAKPLQRVQTLVGPVDP